jgi:hypothetical protein
MFIKKPQNGHNNNPNNKNRHQYERFVQLAKEAITAGDTIAGESYYQHADHYWRMMQGSNNENGPRDNNREPNHNRETREPNHNREQRQPRDNNREHTPRESNREHTPRESNHEPRESNNGDREQNTRDNRNPGPRHPHHKQHDKMQPRRNKPNPSSQTIQMDANDHNEPPVISMSFEEKKVTKSAPSQNDQTNVQSTASKKVADQIAHDLPQFLKKAPVKRAPKVIDDSTKTKPVKKENKNVGQTESES